MQPKEEHHEVSANLLDKHQEVWPNLLDKHQEVWPNLLDKHQEVWPNLIDEHQEVSPNLIDEHQEVSPNLLDEHQVSPNLLDEHQEVWPSLQRINLLNALHLRPNSAFESLTRRLNLLYNYRRPQIVWQEGCHIPLDCGKVRLRRGNTCHTQPSVTATITKDIKIGTYLTFCIQDYKLVRKINLVLDGLETVQKTNRLMNKREISERKGENIPSSDSNNNCQTIKNTSIIKHKNVNAIDYISVDKSNELNAEQIPNIEDNSTEKMNFLNSTSQNEKTEMKSSLINVSIKHVQTSSKSSNADATETQPKQQSPYKIQPTNRKNEKLKNRNKSRRRKTNSRNKSLQDNQRKQLNKFLDQNLNDASQNKFNPPSDEIKNDEERLNALNRKMSNQMHGKDAEPSYFNMDSFVDTRLSIDLADCRETTELLSGSSDEEWRDEEVYEITKKTLTSDISKLLQPIVSQTSEHQPNSHGITSDDNPLKKEQSSVSDNNNPSIIEEDRIKKPVLSTNIIEENLVERNISIEETLGINQEEQNERNHVKSNTISSKKFAEAKHPKCNTIINQKSNKLTSQKSNSCTFYPNTSSSREDLTMDNNTILKLGMKQTNISIKYLDRLRKSFIDWKSRNNKKKLVSKVISEENNNHTDEDNNKFTNTSNGKSTTTVGRKIQNVRRENSRRRRNTEDNAKGDENNLILVLLLEPSEPEQAWQFSSAYLQIWHHQPKEKPRTLQRQKMVSRKGNNHTRISRNTEPIPLAVEISS